MLNWLQRVVLRPIHAPMDAWKVDLIMQFALAIAGERDGVRGSYSSWERELGPIHLVKYVYLADLAHAAAHNGETFTGAPWCFHHYGPWAREVWRRIPTAMKGIGARERHFQSKYSEDATRWSAPADRDLAEHLGTRLPFEVQSAVKHAVKEYGAETPALLHAVYTTAPMLQAEPEEALDMSAAVVVAPPAPAGVRPMQPLSKTQLGKLRRKVEEKLQETRRRRAQPRQVLPGGAPEYDATYFAGLDWLDSLAGEDISETSGEAVVSKTVWKSIARRAPKLP